MGLCQQFDVLYNELNARQHLELVCKIKGIGNDSQRQINEILELVMLTRHQNLQPIAMSGGMKRKLSLAMALVGNSRTIILDEPTSGLDVESRRQVWDLIMKIRENHSIIMSTQHIEEADVLSNRICVMSHGKVIALDTPANIKRRFGVGYNVLVEPVNPSQLDQDQIRLLADRARNAAFSSGINGIQESKDSLSKRLIFLVPYNEVEKISGLIKRFEDDFPEMFVDVEMNSLEDAYIKMVENEQP
jgi:ATP-binding cassette subfamily A (ABC1) protein 3